MSNAEGIHPTAIVGSEARIAPDVTVGAYCVIRGQVNIGAGSVVLDHSVIYGPTVIGRNCRIGPAAYVGMDPQHMRFVPDPAAPTYLVIGDNVIVREGARLARSTAPGLDHATRIGDNCFIMGAAHVGHDCVLEPHVILADDVLLGGHCRIGERTFLGGGCTVHQVVRVGRLVVVAGNEAFSQDVPPFAAVRYGRLKGYNAIGCRRAGLDPRAIHAIRGCYNRLRKHRTTTAALSAIRAELPDLPEVREFVEAIECSRRGIVASHPGKKAASRFEAETPSEVEAG